MLTPNDQKKVDYCKENNNGICSYIHRVCDGLCNNCRLNTTTGESNKIIPANNWWCVNEDAEKLIHYDTEE